MPKYLVYLFSLFAIVIKLLVQSDKRMAISTTKEKDFDKGSSVIGLNLLLLYEQ